MEKDADLKSQYNPIRSPTNSLNRVFFLDHFRTFLIILVVIFHTSIAYIVNANDVWYIINPQKNIVFDAYAFLFDKTVMPMLFFISGYFALSSIIKRNTISFLKRKFIRLGVPFIFGLYLVNPFSAYIIDLYNNKISNDFFNYWSYNYITKFPYTFQLWFIILLIIITIIFSIIYTFNKKIFDLNNKTNFSYKFLLLFIFIIGLSLFIGNLFISDLKWAGFGGFLILQPSRFVLFISYFLLGAFAFRNKIFSKKTQSDNFLIIIVTTSILAILNIFFYIFFHTETSKYLLLGFINAFLWSFLVLFSLLTFIKLFQKKFNYSSKFGKKLSINSYGIFILHYPFVLTFQYILLKWSISPFIKFIMVVVITIFLTYLISEYILHRIPVIKNIL